MCKRFHMIKVYENGSLVPAWPLSGPMNACLLLFCRLRHWQSLTRQWLSHQRKEPAADRGQPHQTRLSRGPAREPWQQTPPDPHLQLSGRHPPLCPEPLPLLRKDVLPGPHFPLAIHTHTRTCTPGHARTHAHPPSLLPLRPLLSQSSSACVNLQPAETQKAAKVFKNALWMHDGGRLTLQGITKYTRMEMRYIQLSLSLCSWVTLDLNCMMFELHRSTGRWSELLFSLFYFPVPDVSIFLWSHTTVEVWYQSLRIKHVLKQNKTKTTLSSLRQPIVLGLCHSLKFKIKPSFGHTCIFMFWKKFVNK